MLKAFYIKVSGLGQFIRLKLSYGMLKRPKQLSYANSVYHDPGGITAKLSAHSYKEQIRGKGLSNSKIVFLNRACVKWESVYPSGMNVLTTRRVGEL